MLKKRGNSGARPFFILLLPSQTDTQSPSLSHIIPSQSPLLLYTLDVLLQSQEIKVQASWHTDKHTLSVSPSHKLYTL